ncbi:hypothetical protein J6590_003841 [Homalodisca vitripennis]|nr:hypothetical protein J6590_003841 [Homalodisca vitripennis]
MSVLSIKNHNESRVGHVMFRRALEFPADQNLQVTCSAVSIGHQPSAAHHAEPAADIKNRLNREFDCALVSGVRGQRLGPVGTAKSPITRASLGAQPARAPSSDAGQGVLQSSSHFSDLFTVSCLVCAFSRARPRGVCSAARTARSVLGVDHKSSQWQDRQCFSTANTVGDSNDWSCLPTGEVQTETDTVAGVGVRAGTPASLKGRKRPLEATMNGVGADHTNNNVKSERLSPATADNNSSSSRSGTPSSVYPGTPPSQPDRPSSPSSTAPPVDSLMGRNYSDFMRSLAAKYNNNNPNEKLCNKLPIHLKKDASIFRKRLRELLVDGMFYSSYLAVAVRMVSQSGSCVIVAQASSRLGNLS